MPPEHLEGGPEERHPHQGGSRLREDGTNRARRGLRTAGGVLAVFPEQAHHGHNGEHVKDKGKQGPHGKRERAYGVHEQGAEGTIQGKVGERLAPLAAREGPAPGEQEPPRARSACHAQHRDGGTGYGRDRHDHEPNRTGRDARGTHGRRAAAIQTAGKRGTNEHPRGKCQQDEKAEPHEHPAADIERAGGKGMEGMQGRLVDGQRRKRRRKRQVFEPHRDLTLHLMLLAIRSPKPSRPS